MMDNLQKCLEFVPETQWLNKKRWNERRKRIQTENEPCYAIQTPYAGDTKLSAKVKVILFICVFRKQFHKICLEDSLTLIIKPV